MKSHNYDEPYMSASGEPPPSTADMDGDFRRDLLDLIPFLRAFSRSLCGDRELADDLAQEALAKAWQSRDTFRAGSNLKAWLFTILRNQFYSDRHGTSLRRSACRSPEASKPGRFNFPTPRVPFGACRRSSEKR